MEIIENGYFADEEEVYLAIEVRKIKVEDNFYMLYPVSLINYMECELENGIIEKFEVNKKIFKADSAKFLRSDEESAYIGEMSLKTLKKAYPDIEGDFLEDYEDDYYNEYFNYIYFLTRDKPNSRFKILPFSKKSLRRTVSDKIEDENNSKIYDTTISFEVSALRKVLDSYETKNEEDLNDFFNLISNVMEVIDGNLSVDEEQRQEKKEETRLETSVKIKKQSKINSKELYNEITKVVKGQDEAIKRIISAAQASLYAEYPTQKRNALIVGPTGSGKTEIMTCLGNCLDKPFVRVDSTNLTSPGYVGGSNENDIFLPLIKQASGNIKKAEEGIIFLDEIDKKGSVNNEDVSGRGALNSLLATLEGTKVNIPYNFSQTTFDTSKLIVFAGGAFTELEEIKEKVGFNKETENTKSIYSTERLIDIGLMPKEFIGRFPIIAHMNELTEDILVEILLESEKSPFLHLVKYFSEQYKVEVKYEDSFIREIARKAYNLKSGARSLATVIEETIMHLRWEIDINEGKYKECILKKEQVNNPKKFILK